MVTCQIDKIECIKQTVFQCHLFISNAIHQVHMNLFNLDQSTMGQLSFLVFEKKTGFLWVALLCELDNWGTPNNRFTF